MKLFLFRCAKCGFTTDVFYKGTRLNDALNVAWPQHKHFYPDCAGSEPMEKVQGRRMNLYAKITSDLLVTARLSLLEKAMEEIDNIRNDIVGRQSLNWSAHVYPLVEILNKCGFEGLSYKKAKAEVQMGIT